MRTFVMTAVFGGSTNRPLSLVSLKFLALSYIVASGSEGLLQELVRAADAEWGRMMGERPYFNKPGAVPHPDDPYTPESVRHVLTDLLDQLATEVDNRTT